MKREVEEAEQKGDDAIIMYNSVVNNNGDTSFRLQNYLFSQLQECKQILPMKNEMLQNKNKTRY